MVSGFASMLATNSTVGISPSSIPSTSENGDKRVGNVPLDVWKFVKLFDRLEHDGSGVLAPTPDGVICSACRETVPASELFHHVVGPSRWWISRHRRRAWRLPRLDDSPEDWNRGEVGSSPDDGPLLHQLERLRDERTINDTAAALGAGRPFKVLETRDRVYCRVCDSTILFDPKTRRSVARSHLTGLRHRAEAARTLPEPEPIPPVLDERRFGRAPVERLVRNLKRRLRGKAAAELKFEEAVGCSAHELAAKLEAQFGPGMTWENYGSHHVDHVMPVSAFDMACPLEAMLATHWSNLRPLWGHENLRKGASLRS